MKKLFLLLLISVLSIPCFAQLTYRLNIEGPGQQVNYATWKSQDGLLPISVRVLHTNIGSLKEAVFYKNGQERFRLEEEGRSWTLHDSESNQTLIYEGGLNTNGTYTFSDGTVLHRERQPMVKPGIFNRVKNEDGELVAVAFHGRELPEAMSQLTVKILEPTVNDELLFAMLALALQRRHYTDWLFRSLENNFWY